MIGRLLLVRHGVTKWNREGRFQGHLDAPLAEEGRREADLLGARLAVDPPDRIVSSPLSRAADTASIIAARLPRPVEQVEHDARLMEIGQGEWEGRTHDQLATQDAQRYASWRERAGEEQPPGAETIQAALARVADLVDGVTAAGAERGDTGSVCLVSHGGILRLVARHLLALDARRAWSMDVDNASLSILGRVPDGGWRLEGWNDTAHLLGRTEQHVDEAEGEPLAL